MSREQIASNVLLLDGAMGTELMRRGLKLPLPIWSADANLTHPELVQAVHRDYASAGADILTANTFRTTPRTYHKAGYSSTKARERAHDSLRYAIDLARSVAKSNCRVAGSIAPLEDCYSPELFPGRAAAIEEYQELGEWFKTAGLELILIETMSHLDEIDAVLEATNSLGLERWISFILKDGEHLLSGNPLREALVIAESFRLGTVLLNCNSLPVTRAGIDTLKSHWQQRWGVYPNLGLSTPEPNGKINSLIPLKQIEDEAVVYLNQGATVIGTCCGSTPEHTKILRRLIDSAADQ